MEMTELTREEAKRYSEKLADIAMNIESVVVGKRFNIALLLIAMICGGHVLVEDVPGVGKTILANSFAKSVSLSFNRIQCTPDMLPSDITGFTMYDINTNKKTFNPGPIMNQIFLADEINRTSPKTQAALLEAMEEGQVTVDGVTYELPSPFMVIATQNPIESVGTFPLPEAQMDRFLMRISLGYPDAQQEKLILNRFNGENPMKNLRPVATAQDILELREAVSLVSVSEAIKNYIIALVSATRNSEYITLGASPRASLALMKASQACALLQHQTYVTPENVKVIAEFVLAHRLILSKEAAMNGLTKNKVIEKIVSSVDIPTK